nr:hypothetical protein [Pseudonocardia sp. C8]
MAASARAGVQIVERFDEAPLAYSLSAVAGFVYILATVGLAGTGPGFRRLAWFAVTFELVGVLTVGAFTALVPGDFPRNTVWTWFGMGYGFVPLVLPFAGIWWLRRTARSG